MQSHHHTWAPTKLVNTMTFFFFDLKKKEISTSYNAVWLFNQSDNRIRHARQSVP